MYPLQIRRKCISNQLRGLLEVEPLHFTCCAASESTRVEALDPVASQQFSNHMQYSNHSLLEDLMFDNALSQYDTIGGNGTPVPVSVPSSAVAKSMDKVDKAIDISMEGTLQYFKTSEDDMMNNMKNMLADKIFTSTLQMKSDITKYKGGSSGGSSMATGSGLAKSSTAGGSSATTTGSSTNVNVGVTVVNQDGKFMKIDNMPMSESMLKKLIAKGSASISKDYGDLYAEYSEEVPAHLMAMFGPGGSVLGAGTGPGVAGGMDQVPAPMHGDLDSANMSASMSKRISEFLNENMCDDGAELMPWHKLLTLPPKQMIVVDRMHSGARRFVTLDFGQPVMLTDVVSIRKSG